MKTFKLLFAIVTVMLCFYSVPARAELITIAISGQITSISDPYNHFGGQIRSGDTIVGTYTYDTKISGLTSYEYHSPPAGISLGVGGFNFQTNPANVDFALGIENDNLAGEDYYGLISRNNLSLPDGAPVQYISWQLYDPTGTALSSNSFPLTAPDVSKWSDSIYANVLWVTHDRDFDIQATITSATPEPATIFLLGLGLVLARKRFSN
jgi:hypothetical protein